MILYSNVRTTSRKSKLPSIHVIRDYIQEKLNSVIKYRIQVSIRTMVLEIARRFRKVMVDGRYLLLTYPLYEANKCVLKPPLITM